MLPNRKRLKPGARVAVSLALTHVDLMVEHISLDERLLARIHSARVLGDTVRVRCTLSELGELAKRAATEAKNAKGGALQEALDAISKTAAEVAQSHYYAPLPNNTSSRLRLVRIQNG